MKKVDHTEKSEFKTNSCKIDASQTFPVYMFRGRFPVSMHQYSRLLCMSRVPHTGCDELVQQDSTKVQHIVVLACDQVYTLNVFEWVDEKRQHISIDRLEK
jgi:carnitine O-acetyltransferase